MKEFNAVDVLFGVFILAKRLLKGLVELVKEGHPGVIFTGFFIIIVPLLMSFVFTSMGGRLSPFMDYTGRLLMSVSTAGFLLIAILVIAIVVIKAIDFFVLAGYEGAHFRAKKKVDPNYKDR